MVTKREVRWLEGLSDTQKAAATAETSRLAIVAAPGSGKTQVLAARIVDLVERKGIHPSKIIAFAFTRSAAAELKARVESLGGDSLALVTVTTFHAFALRVLREDPEAVQLPPAFSIARETEAVSCFAGMYEGPMLRPESRKVSASKLKEAQSLFYATGTYPADPPSRTLLSVFADRLREVGLVHAGSLLPLLVAGLPRSERMRLTAATYVHVLVDEAHDASPLEMNLVELLASSTIDDEKGGSLSIVADPFQAIYGWRHAVGSSVVKGFLEHKGGMEVRLSWTYRCAPAIAAYARRIGRESARDQDVPSFLSASETAGEGVVHAVHGANLRAHVDQAIASYGGGKVAILCRTRRDAHALGLAFADVAESVHGEEGDARWFEIAQACARLVLNHEDNAAFRTIYEAEEPYLASRPRFYSFASRAGRARSLRAEYLAEYATAHGEEGSLLAWTVAQGPDVTIDAIADRVILFDRPNREGTTEETYGPTLDAFNVRGFDARAALDALATRSEADAFAAVAARGKVQVSTVHAAKGREWDAVFVVTTDRWPWGLPASKPTGWRDEEWRVLYVAVTRARREVAIVHGDEAPLAALGLA